MEGRDSNQYAQYNTQPEKQKREAIQTSHFAFPPFLDIKPLSHYDTHLGTAI